MPEAVVGLLSTLFATVVGGVLVILTNYISERRIQRREEQALSDRNAALMTALFVIRNFILEALNNSDEDMSLSQSVSGLKAAQINLNSVIEKSPPEVQYVMATCFGISLRLADLITAVEHELGDIETARRHDLLLDALAEFDVFASQDLTILSSDEIRDIVSNPEDVPD